MFARLRRRWLWVAVGFVVAALSAVGSVASLGLSAPFIKLKPLAFSTAYAQLVVGTPTSVTQATSSIQGLTLRGEALGDMLTSPELRQYVAHAAGIPASQLVVDGPVAIDIQRTQQEPTGEKRSNQIVREGDVYRLTIDDDYATPELNVTAQAPSTAAATDLANATAVGINAYLTSTETAARTPVPDRLQVSQVQPATASPPGRSGVAQVAMLAFLGVFIVWCGLVLALSGVVDHIRAAREIPGPHGVVPRPSPRRTA